MFYVALALILAAPTFVLAWLYLRLELELRTEDRISTPGLDAAFEAFIDLADDQPFGIRSPSLGTFQSEPINGWLRGGT